MYALRDSSGRFVARSRSKAGAHRRARSSKHFGVSVNRVNVLPSGYLSAPTRMYSVRYVHKIAPRDTDVGPRVRISSADLQLKSALARTLRDQKVLGAGARVRDFRVEGFSIENSAARIIVFPTMPGLTTYWHSIILTRED